VSPAPISPRDRRALRLAAAVSVGALAWAFGVMPAWRTYQDAREQLATERRMLAREVGLLAASERVIAAAAEGGRREAAVVPRLFVAPTVDVASAALAGYLQEQADDAGVTVTQLSPPVEPGGRLPTGPVAVRIEGRGDLETVLTLLRELERGPKLVHLDSIDIAAGGRAERRVDARGEDAAEPTGDESDEQLTFSFTTTGFMHPGIVDQRRTPPAARAARAATGES
jgi:hypothetical protein